MVGNGLQVSRWCFDVAQDLAFVSAPMRYVSQSGRALQGGHWQAVAQGVQHRSERGVRPVAPGLGPSELTLDVVQQPVRLVHGGVECVVTYTAAHLILLR
jgi:hypothetical protein